MCPFQKMNSGANPGAFFVNWIDTPDTEYSDPAEPQKIPFGLPLGTTKNP